MHNCTDYYEQSGAINGSLTLSINNVAQSINFFMAGRPVHNEIGKTHQQINVFIYG